MMGWRAGRRFLCPVHSAVRKPMGKILKVGIWVPQELSEWNVNSAAALTPVLQVRYTFITRCAILEKSSVLNCDYPAALTKEHHPSLWLMRPHAAIEMKDMILSFCTASSLLTGHKAVGFPLVQVTAAHALWLKFHEWTSSSFYLFIIF